MDRETAKISSRAVLSDGSKETRRMDSMGVFNFLLLDSGWPKVAGEGISHCDNDYIIIIRFYPVQAVNAEKSMSWIRDQKGEKCGLGELFA